MRKQASILLRKSNARITYLVSASSSATGRMGKKWPGALLARRAEEGMEPDDLLCSRNARPQKVGKGSLVVLLLAERARSEGARSTRAIEDQPGCP